MSKIFEVAKVIEEARVKVKTHGKGEEEKWQAVIDGYELQNQEIQKYLAEVIARLDEDAQRKNLSTDRAVYSKVINKCFEKQIAKQTFSLDEKLQAKVIFNNALAKFDLLEGIEQR